MAFQSATVNKEESTATTLGDKYKRMVATMLTLQILSQKDCYIQEVADYINRTSNGLMNYTRMGSVFTLLELDGSIRENGKRLADGRMRRYYTVTEKGRELLAELLTEYKTWSDTTKQILSSAVVEPSHKE